MTLLNVVGSLGLSRFAGSTSCDLLLFRNERKTVLLQFLLTSICKVEVFAFSRTLNHMQYKISGSDADFFRRPSRRDVEWGKFRRERAPFRASSAARRCVWRSSFCNQRPPINVSQNWVNWESYSSEMSVPLYQLLFCTFSR